MIYKGCQKRMIMLKNTGSEIFEEAYFILKELPKKPAVTESDMVREANRIIEENLLTAYCRKSAPLILRDNMKRLFWYLAGLVTSGSIMGLIMLLC